MSKMIGSCRACALSKASKEAERDGWYTVRRKLLGPEEISHTASGPIL